jgi:hypothetical protein
MAITALFVFIGGVLGFRFKVLIPIVTGIRPPPTNRVNHLQYDLA